MRGKLRTNLACGALVGCATAAPVLEYAPAPQGPWSPDSTAHIVEMAPGRYEVVRTAEGPAEFFRVTDSGLGHCILGIEAEGDSIRLLFAQATVDTDGDGVGDRPEPPPGMAWVAAGNFLMGDSLGEGTGWERPAHVACTDAFLIDTHEVSTELWNEVYQWAIQNGYSFVNAGRAKGPYHPVHTIEWYDAVKWCNARSERDGLCPVYHAGSGMVYRSGNRDLSQTDVLWGARGYRLPTEAEWEKAARGGLMSRRFPWGDTITQNLANYRSASPYPYDLSVIRGDHPDWSTGPFPYTAPVGSFAPNLYGLHDMAGNVWEWCWDWLNSEWYGRGESQGPNPRGPERGMFRVVRGGGWHNAAINLRCAHRGGYRPTVLYNGLGFRCVRAQ